MRVEAGGASVEVDGAIAAMIRKLLAAAPTLTALGAQQGSYQLRFHITGQEVRHAQVLTNLAGATMIECGQGCGSRDKAVLHLRADG